MKNVSAVFLCKTPQHDGRPLWAVENMLPMFSEQFVSVKSILVSRYESQSSFSVSLRDFFCCEKHKKSAV